MSDSPPPEDPASATRPLLVARGLLVLLALATVVGMAWMWPGERSVAPGAVERPPTLPAAVTEVREAPCPAGIDSTCIVLDATVGAGTYEGETFPITYAGTDVSTIPRVGDRIRVYESEVPPEAMDAAGEEIPPVFFADFDRRIPLGALFAFFAIVVVAVSRWQGLRSLVGLGLSFVFVVTFTIPAMLAGSSPIVIALITAVAVMFLTLTLTHGVGPTMTCAALGSVGALVVTVGVAVLVSESARLTGLVSDEALYLQAQDTQISLLGLLLAGIVIAALGVLDDVTVSQASTVAALRAASPELDRVQVMRRAFVVGRDHIAATVNTLVLAYAGSSLTVLLVFSVGGTSFLDAVNNEAVAAEIVAVLAGSLGLLAAMPLTTALAAWVVHRLPVEALGRHGHVH